MNVQAQWKSAKKHVSRIVTEICAARDAHRGSAWERLSVAYPDPIEARRAIELFQLTRLELTATAG